MQIYFIMRARKFTGFCLTFFCTVLLAQTRPPLLIPPITPFEVSSYSTKDSKKPQIPTSWGGNSLTQQTKTIQGIPFTTFSLDGGAWIYHKKVKLSASSIEVVGEDALMGFLKGGVKVEDKENHIFFTAQKATYNKFEETILLEGRPTLYYKGANNKTTKITAPIIKRYMTESKVILEGKVIMEDGEFTIIGDNGTYYEKENEFVIDDYPFIFGKQIFATAEKATYNNVLKKTILQNKALIAQISYETKSVNLQDTSDSVKIDKNIQKKEVEEKERVLTLFNGDMLEYQIKTDALEAFIKLNGNVNIYHKTYHYFGNSIRAFGEGFKNLDTKEEFSFLDKVNQFKLSGNVFEHFEDQNYSHVTGNPKIDFLDTQENIKATLTAYEIERFADKKEIVARGNVKIEAEESIARGQYATYFEESKKIILEGNPSLERGGTRVSCGRIILFPDTNQIILSEGVHSKGKSFE